VPHLELLVGAGTADGSARLAAERVVLPGLRHVLDVRGRDVLAVRPPMTAAEWQVMYDDSYLDSGDSRAAAQVRYERLEVPNVLRAGETPADRHASHARRPESSSVTVTFHVE